MFICDVGLSPFGTYVNDKHLRGVYTELKQGNIIGIGVHPRDFVNDDSDQSYLFSVEQYPVLDYSMKRKNTIEVLPESENN